MSTLDYITEMRRRQIDRMEGREPAGEPPSPPVPIPTGCRRSDEHRQCHIRFSPHAHQRMSQRNMKAAEIYAIMRAGEQVRQPDGRTVYRVTSTSLTDATCADAKLLRRHLGAAIVVSADQVLVTVMYAGEDTRGWRR